jgi:hypothetical protein
MSGKRYQSCFDYVVSTAILASAVLALSFGVAGLLASDYSQSLRLLYIAAVAALVQLLLGAILLLYDAIKPRDAPEKVEVKENEAG